MELRTITQEEFNQIYKLHLDYLESFGHIGIQADLSYTDLKSIILPKETECKRSNDRSTVFRFYLKGTYLQNSILRGTDLSGLNLSNSDFGHADLSYANLSGCILNGAYLFSANLEGANLQYADLTNIDLENANLADANLDNAILDDNSLSGSIIGDATILSPSLDRKFLYSAKLPIKYHIQNLLSDSSNSKSEEYYKSLFEEDKSEEN